MRVAIVRGSNPQQMSYAALEMIDAATLFSPSSKVLVKPNCVFHSPPESGVNTSSHVLEGVIHFLLAAGARDITIGEGGNKDTAKTFKLIGVEAVAQKYGLPLVNFNEDKYDLVKVPEAKVLRQVPIARTVLESTCIVNVPVLKIHHMAQVTLSMKNLMGVIVGDRGAIMHRNIDEKLVDLATLVKPTVNVVDGILGSEMDEVHGYPVRVNTVIAGENMVATDAVASAVMGVDPSSVRHLKLAAARHLGPNRLDAITLLGHSLASVQTRFRQGFSQKRLQSYGFNHAVDAAVLRPLWERVQSNLPPPQPIG